MMQLVPLFFCMHTLLIINVQSQISASFNDNNSAFCCSAPGPQVDTQPISALDIIYQSPQYVQVTTYDDVSQPFDNVCYTFFPLADNTFFQYSTFTYVNGTYTTSQRIVAPLPGYCGVARTQGLSQNSRDSTIVYDWVYLGSPCPGLNVLYIHYLGGNCDILNSATRDPAYTVQAHSTTRDVSDYCKSQVAAVANSQLSCTNLTVLPNQLNRRCVTQLYGMRCINADSVLPQDSVTVPETEPVCPGVYTY